MNGSALQTKLHLAAFRPAPGGQDAQSLTFRLTKGGKLVAEVQLLVEVPRFSDDVAIVDKVLSSFAADLADALSARVRAAHE